jgi:ABC-type sugar transport system ATPase subunit
MFGLLGAGCNEAALAVYGAWQGPVSGRIEAFGREASIANPGDAIANGIGLIAQDRRDSLVPEHSILNNAMLASLQRFSVRGWIDWPRIRARIRELVERLSIKAPSIDLAVSALSGGNQQKVQIARWLASAVKILLLVDPTRGVDVGSRTEITRVWRELAARGYALLLVSTDAEELVDVCDRVLVLRNGVQTAELSHAALSEASLLRAAAGV